MKNRFGFIPIVLPAIVMVLIIGLINMAGPQTPVAEADTINEDGPRLNSSDGLTVVGVRVHPTDTDVSVQLNQADADGGTGYDQNVGDYTATVPFNVNYVTIGTNATDPVTATVSPSTDANIAVDGQQVALAPGATTVITVTASANQASQNYVVKVTRQKPQIVLGIGNSNTPGSPAIAKGATTTDRPPVTPNPAFVAGVTKYDVNLDYADEQVTIEYIAPADESVTNNRADSPNRGDYRTTVSVSPDNSGIANDGYQVDLTPGVSKKATISYSRQIFLGWIRKTSVTDPGQTPPTVTHSYANVNTTTVDAQDNTVFTHTLHPGSMSDGWSNVSTETYMLDFLRAKPGLDVSGLKLFPGVNTSGTQIDLESDRDHPDANYQGNLGRGNYWVRIIGDEDTATGTATTTDPNDTTNWTECAVGTNVWTDVPNGWNKHCAGDNENLFLTPAANKDANGFAPLVVAYNATVPYNIATVTLQLALVADPADTPAHRKLKATLKAPGETGDPAGVISHLQVAVQPGDDNVIQLQVAAGNESPPSGSLYVIRVERENPVLPNNSLRICEGDLTGADNNGTACNNVMSRITSTPATESYDVDVDYDVTELTVVAPPPAGHTVSMTNVTQSTDAQALTGADPATTTPLVVGDNKIRVRVAFNGNTRDYTINVTRGLPELNFLNVSVDRNGDGDFGDAGDTADHNAASAYARGFSTSTSYSGNRARILVSRPYTMAGPTDIDLIITRRHSGGVFQTIRKLSWETTTTSSGEEYRADTEILPLPQGVSEFTVRIGGDGGAEYKVNITRAAPEIALNVWIDEGGDDLYERGVTTTSTTYSDTLKYSESKALIEVNVNRPAAPLTDDPSVEIMKPGDSGYTDMNWPSDVALALGVPSGYTNSGALDLNVGENQFKVRVGGTAVYTVTLTREEGLTPEISFTLLNDKNVSLGGGAASFMLDASSRQYDFIEETKLDADILLTAAKVRICVADPDGDDVRVSIEDVDVPWCPTYLERDLQQGSNQLLFDVAHPGDPDGSLHAVSINRADNSKPAFPANASIRFRDADSPIIAIDGEPFSPTVELPFATGGNGTLKYRLLSVEASGLSTTLPSGMTGHVLPNGRDTKGRLGIAPIITDGSDKATFTLALEVTDSDAVTNDDSDKIEFTVEVYRSKDLVPPGAGLEPIAGELIDLVVRGLDTTSVEVNLLTGAQAFKSSDYSYSVVVFTDERDVDIYALPRTTTSTVTVALEGSRTSNNVAPPGDSRSGWHTWEGFQLRRGPGVSNTYSLVVTEGTTTPKRYTVTLTRDPDTAPSFPKRADTKDFYEGISLSMLEAGGVSLDAATGGNGALTYFLKRSDALAPTSSMEYLGLSFASTAKGGKLSGTPDLDAANPSRRLSDSSEVYTTYTAHDADANENVSDAANMAVTIRVHRDLTLESYSVNGVKVSNLGKASMTYKSDGVFSHTEIDSYIYNAPYNATQVTFEATARDRQSTSTDQQYATVKIDDADKKKDGNQINLKAGDNFVTVTVRNGRPQNVATHVINIKRPGLQLVTNDRGDGIRIEEDQDARGGFLSDEVKLSPAFDRDEMMYTATVETWVESVKVYANPADPTARVWVNDFEISDRQNYSVVDLAVGENSIRVGAVPASNTSTPPALIYTVKVTREADTAPSFSATTPNYIRLEGVPVDRQPCGPIVLPMAMGGNGEYTYSLRSVEALPPGLSFDPATSTRMISGTPSLDEGYESIFDLVYAVRDADGNTAASDGATAAFTITITNDKTKLADDPTCVTDVTDPALPSNTLSSLVVTYTLDGRTDITATLDPKFDPNSGGPYTATIPNGATDVEVRANRADDGATISMNNVRIDSGVKLNLPPQATIRVRYPGQSEMIYTLNTKRVSNTAPDFGLATVEDKTYPSGKDITPETLPAATGGNRTLTYTLVDHEGNLPDGLVFTASSRELSGRPTLVQDADTTLYRMTYMVVDADGQSDKIEFNITVCDEDRAANCEQAPVNPGYTPMDLQVSRAGNAATLTWTPGDDAASHLVVAVDLNNIVASAGATGATLGGDAKSHEFTGLSDGVSYIYVVIGFDANGGYTDLSTSSGYSGMAISE